MNRRIYGHEKASRRPLGWNFRTFELGMRANEVMFTDVGSCSSECTLPSLKPRKLYIALQTKCRVSNCGCYLSTKTLLAVIASYAHMYNIEMSILYIKGVTCPSLVPPNSGTSTYLSHHSTATSPSMFGTGRRPIPFAGRKASHNGLIARPYTGWMADCSELLLAISPREWKMEELFGGNATTHICDHTPPLEEHK